MIDTLLELLPIYGLLLIGGAVIASCLAFPLPSSMLVMASGGFAAAGDLVFWQVVAVAFGGFVLGDQIAYGVARWGGSRVVDRLKSTPRRASLIERGETIVARWGSLAVLASRTIVSPLGPWVSFVCGGVQLNWLAFTLPALVGAAVWAVAYASLGYFFASQISSLSSLILTGAGVILAAAAVVGSGWWLWQSWTRHQRRRAKSTP